MIMVAAVCAVLKTCSMPSLSTMITLQGWSGEAYSFITGLTDMTHCMRIYHASCSLAMIMVAAVCAVLKMCFTPSLSTTSSEAPS